MRILELIGKPAALASGWTSAVLCLSAASGFWLAGEHRKAAIWLALGAAEITAIVW